MKNKKKIWLISFICFGAGIVILILGILLGGRPGFYFDSDGLHSGTDDAEQKSYVRGENKLEEFTSIDIDLDYADLQIIPSDTFRIEYCLVGPKKPVCTVKEGHLTVREAEYRRFFNFTFMIPQTGDLTDNYVKLYIPENTVFNTVHLQTEDGDIKLPALKADTMDIRSEYGDVTLKDFEGTTLSASLDDGQFSGQKIKTERIEMTNEYGDISLKELESDTLDAGLSDGDFTVERLITESAEIENEYGDVHLGLFASVKDYSLDLVTEYGNIQIPEYDVISGDDGSQCRVTGTSGKTVKVSCEDGDIRIFDAR